MGGIDRNAKLDWESLKLEISELLADTKKTLASYVPAEDAEDAEDNEQDDEQVDDDWVDLDEDDADSDIVLAGQSSDSAWDK